MMANVYFLGIDIGTSSTKTGLWRDDGALMAEASSGYRVIYPQPTWAETDAMDWWQATCATIREVLGKSGAAPGQIAGIGVDGLSWAMVAADASGEPLFPALIWLDRRAEAEALELQARPDATRLINLDPNPLDAAYVTPKLLWLKRHEPQVFEATHQFLTSSSFIVQRLTGAFTCDFTQAYAYHFFDMRRERWDEEAADALGVPLAKLPPLYQSCEIAGRVSEQAARLTGLVAGTPVIAGALDAAAGAFGSGLARVGQSVDQGGTAFGITICVDRVLVEPRLIFSHHVVPGQYLLQGGTVGGASLSWFRDVLGQPEVSAAQILDASPFALMSREAREAPPGAHGLFYLPYMAGERSPLWNNDARGVFFGLSYNTNRRDILRAVMEGCAFATYHNVRVAEATGVHLKEWIGIGGATASDVWCQIKADISGRPFTVPRRADGGSGDNTLGLAVMVARAVGVCDDMAAQIEAFLPDRTVYQPDAQRHALYQDLFEVYLSLSERLQPEFEKRARVVARHQDVLGYPLAK